MEKRTISGIKIPENVQRYIRHLKYKYILLNTVKNSEERKKIEKEYEINPYASSTPKEKLIQNILSITQSKAFKRILNKTMAHPSNNINSDKTVKRMVHSVSAAGLMLEYCSELKLNKELGMAIALGHDVGHTAFGHEGEQLFRNIARESGLGTYAHNLQGRLLLDYVEKPDISPDVLDGIQCHNGEREEFEVPVNYDKTVEDSKSDFIQCLAHKDKEREQIPGTFEGAAFRIIDKISYVGQDLADGFREKLLDPRKLDPELIAILSDIGVDQKKINTLLSQDKDYSLATIEMIIQKIKNFPISSMTSQKTESKIKKCLENLEKLKSIDFNDNVEFNTMLSKTASGLNNVAKSVNLDGASLIMFRNCATNLDSLMNQDTSGGRLAREIEEIFMRDFIENSKNKDHPCMSERMGDLMYDLIGYTQETVIPRKKWTPENSELLKDTVNDLVNHYTNVLLASGVIDEIISQIEPDYEQEEKDTHKENGIFDDVETLKIDSKIVGHTRKLFAQNKEYFDIVFDVIKEAEKSDEVKSGKVIELTFREKVAKRIAIDYTSRNDEKKLIKKALEKKIITREQEKILNVPTENIEDNGNFKISPSMNLYAVRIGMHTDRMIRKTDKLEKLKKFLETVEDDSLEDLENIIDETIEKLKTTKESYDSVDDFNEKKTHFKAFKRIYGESREHINKFRVTLTRTKLAELDGVLNKSNTAGTPDVAEWDEQAEEEAKKEIEAR